MRAEPMKPAPPVMSSFMVLGRVYHRFGERRVKFLVLEPVGEALVIIILKNIGKKGLPLK